MTTTQSEQINEIAVALVAVQAALRPAVKDSINPHLRNKYADLNSVWDAAREPLTAAAIAVVQLPVPSEAGMIGLRTTLLHRSGQWIAGELHLPCADPKGNVTAQAAGSAITYARRYSLSAMIGICSEEDDDGHAATHARTAAKPAPRQVTVPAQSQPSSEDEAARASEDANFDLRLSAAKDPDEQADLLIAHFGRGFRHAKHKAAAKEKYRVIINALPADARARVIKAFDAARVSGPTNVEAKQ